MLELVCGLPVCCPNKDVRHETDDLKEMHGSKEHPLPVGEKRIDRYVKWEYEEIGRRLPPAHRCCQEMFKDMEKSPVVTVDRIVMRDIGGKHHVFYFDVSEPVNEETEIMKKTWEDMQAGKPVDPKLRSLIEKAEKARKANSRIIKLD